MRKVVVTEKVTLDGVMQAPGRPGEDTRGGFSHGGWALPYHDAAKAAAMGGGVAQAGALLLGRRTYEDFHAVWPLRTDNPFTAFLNGVRKFDASWTLTEPLPWQNSTLLPGGAADAWPRSSGSRARIWPRSAAANRWPRCWAPPCGRAGAAHPPVGARLGTALVPRWSAARSLELDSCAATSTGVIIATYSQPITRRTC